MDNLKKSLVRLAEPINQRISESILTKPLTYRDWYSQHVGLAPAQELYQYNLYLTEWYTQNALTSSDSLSVLQVRFLDFLRQIQAFFSNESILKWYNTINFSDERDLLIAIPYFAKKLKDVALYYRELRQTVKTTKFRDNILGTDLGLSVGVKQRLLEVFTKKVHNTPVNLPNDLWSSIPLLSSIKDTLRVEIIEMYDDNSYFDNSLESSYLESINLASEQEASEFLTTKGLTLTASDWLYTSTLSLSDLTNFRLPANRRTLLTGLASLLLSQDVYSSEVVQLTATTNKFTFNFAKGRNFLYWPSGPFKTTAPKYYKPLALSASGLSERGSAGSSVRTADTIFVKSKKGIEGAWLAVYSHSSAVSTMYAAVDSTQDTIFKFPYPGFGLIAADVPWTGPSLTTEYNFDFLSDEEKNAVQLNYWDFSSRTISSTPIRISESTLSNYTSSSTNYLSADKVRTWGRLPTIGDSLYSGTVNEAWLYRFSTTDIPIRSINTNLILWPYTTINATNGLNPNLPTITKETCNAVALSSVVHVGMIAGDTPEHSDMLFKISNFNEPTNSITEGAWLSGKTMSGHGGAYVAQPGFNIKAVPSTYTKFVWTGPTTALSSVFTTTKHQNDCLYSLNDLSIKESSACSCKQVYYNSFGHPGDTFDEYNKQADFIALVDLSASDIDLSIWKDPSGKDYLTSNNFSWYRSTERLNWGTGAWSNNTMLNTGYCYMYYRANYNDIDITVNVMPFLRKTFKYDFDINNFKWVGVSKNADGDWLESNGTNSQIVLYPGNILKYTHRRASVSYDQRSVSQQQEVQQNKGSVWSNYDYISINNTMPVIISFPSVASSIPDSQTPTFNITKVINATWALHRPDNVTETFKNTLLFSYVPQLTGTYSITVTAEVFLDLTNSVSVSTDTFLSLTNNNNPLSSTYYVFSGVPSITSVMPFTYTTTNLPVSSPAGAFVLNHALTAPTANGIVTFWAKSNTTLHTIESVGNIRRFDSEYNIITQPPFSDIIFNYNTYTQIINTNKTPFVWEQPVSMLSAGDRVVWNKLEINKNTFNLSSESAFGTEVITSSATDIPSDITLNTELLNEQVEVVYNARDILTWTVTLTNSVEDLAPNYLNLSTFLKAQQPWLNILNKFTPTIATFPLISNLTPSNYVSTYFLPHKLGVTAYVGKNNTLVVSQSSGLFSYNSAYPIGGFGLSDNTKSFYKITDEDSAWIKEPISSQAGAGNVSKNVYRTFQKFIPYQSSYETNSNAVVGVMRPNNPQTPWNDSGVESVWGDSKMVFNNKPQVINTNTWGSKQILKFESNKLQQWCSDMYGNQYGLYVPPNTTTGTIWVRTPQHNVKTTTEVLTGVFDKYKTQDFYPSLISGVTDFDIFVDTLYIELSSVVLFEKVFYNEVTDTIYNNASDACTVTLTPFSYNINNIINIKPTNKISKPWYLSDDKKILLIHCELTTVLQAVHFIEYDLHTATIRTIFTVNDFKNISNYKDISTITKLILNYDSVQNNIVAVIYGKTESKRSALLTLSVSYILPQLKNSVFLIDSVARKQQVNLVTPLHYTTTQNSSLSVEVNINTSNTFTLSSQGNNKGNTIIFNSADELGVNYIPFTITVDTGDVIYNTLTINVI